MRLFDRQEQDIGTLDQGHLQAVPGDEEEAVTKIEWANPPGFKGESWNPVSGCSPISPGCANCWARVMAHRFPLNYGGRDKPFHVVRHVTRFGEPRRWRKRRCIFVCSMGDLFHDDVPDGIIRNVWQVMANAQEHKFLVLTKRPERMLKHTQQWDRDLPSNVALGVSVEDQQRADERIPLLLQCPAAMRFISVEPMLGPVRLHCPGCHCCWSSTDAALRDGSVCMNEFEIDWVIIGCESGAKRRTCDWHWMRDLLGQCQDAGVPAFVKQVVMPRIRVSHDPAEWPMYLRVRQWPKFLQETPDA